MFKLEEIHLKTLIKLLNFVNQEFVTKKTCQKSVRTGAKSKLGAKASPKAAATQLAIDSIDLNNRQIVIDSILNCCLYFDQYFKYNYKFVMMKSDDKISKVYKWLQNYYKKEFLDKIDFKVVVSEEPVMKSNINSNDDNNEDQNGETNADEMILGPDPQQEITDTQTQQTDEELSEFTAKVVENLELILLLVLIVFFKVRKLFPKLLEYLDFAWIYLSEFDSQLELELETENLIDLLQNEFVSQRNSNRMRSELLSSEIIQLNAMIENLEKQFEDETKELIYLQNATIINTNNTSANAKQLSKIMTIKSGQPKESKIWTCPECGKQFKNGYKLNRHRYVHKDPSEKPYMCDWPGCGYRSIANNDLNRHRMIHTGEKPFQCDFEGCQRKYSRPDKLNHHKKVAHNKESVNKPFVCDWPGCGYRSIANADLVRHQYIHTGERPYKCEFTGCEKAFSRPDKLRNHKDKAQHNIEELTTVRPSAISIAECVPQAIAWT